MILFLDDEQERHNSIAPDLENVQKAFTANEAIELLKVNKFKEVYLDFSLGYKADTGMVVAQWIVDNKPEIGYIIVHSMDEVEGKKMGRLLYDADYRVCWCPFHRLLNDCKVSEEAKKNPLGMLGVYR